MYVAKKDNSIQNFFINLCYYIRQPWHGASGLNKKYYKFRRKES